MHMPKLNIKNLETALSKRKKILAKDRPDTFRLFNGFTEGCPSLVADVYRHTLLLYNFHKNPQLGTEMTETAQNFSLQKLPWLNAVVIKTRKGETRDLKRGVLTYGEKADIQITEHQVHYALNLRINQDASFYLDTRNLRSWLKQNVKDKTVLNTFAYTGSLGVAALAGKATKIMQMDLSHKFMSIGKRSYKLNEFPVEHKNFIVGDFFSCVKQLKIAHKYFDCVIFDPPFFSATKKGRIDLAQNTKQLINKLRPLINDGGYLVVINNALFLSGTDFMSSIQELCSSDYLSVAEIIPVPQDIVGYPQADFKPLTDPAPFNHSTKIIVLKIKRKQ
ncbi:SAM-dependent methyltransferase [bacterium]|nr:SAM-dependent methyltransferase [bacterium]